VSGPSDLALSTAIAAAVWWLGCATMLSPEFVEALLVVEQEEERTETRPTASKRMVNVIFMV
jgi:hypothetical protein